MKIQGLDKLARKMDEMAKAAGELDGDIASVKFDPEDPASIEAAIQQLYDAVDEKVSAYGNNEWVMAMADQLKENGREAILERAAAARLEPSEGEEK